MMVSRHIIAFASLTALLILVARGRAQNESVFEYPEGAFEPTPSRLAQGTAGGNARFRPSDFRAADIGEYRLEFTVGQSGIAAGGALMVVFPKAWFTNPFPLLKILQQTDARAPHYARVEASRAGTRLEMTIDRINFSGKTERFTRTMTIRVAGSPLQAGDMVTVSLANTTAPYVAGIDEVLVAVDASGGGEFKKIAYGARYETYAAVANELALVAPSQAVVGRPVQLHLTGFDPFYNATEDFIGSFRITGLGEPLRADMGTAEQGNMTIEWTPKEEGFFWPAAQGTAIVNTGTGSFDPFSSVGNPIRVFASEPENKIYWGDLHSHSRISKDAIGRTPFLYARDRAHLDFFAGTEHADDDGSPLADGITPGEWESIKDRVRELYEPGRFVTLLGYECSLPGPSGHHNVIYRFVEGIPWAAHRMKSEQGLWARLSAGDAITIPHHLGIAWGGGQTRDGTGGPGLQPIVTAKTPGGGPAIDWSRHDEPELRPVLEIYSMHGTSELFDPDDALAYEQVDFTPGSSQRGPHYAQDAWEAGRWLGVIAASDNHTAQPGLRQGGLSAVLAPELTREAIFDSLARRSVYATTGERIYMEFEIAGTTMGQRGRRGGPARGKVTLAAAGEIKFAEVIGNDRSGGGFKSVQRWEDPGKLLEADFTVPVGPSGGIYYLRAELKEEVRGRVARAWSSPVWIDP